MPNLITTNNDKKIDLESVLNALDIKPQNYGTSTGSKWTNSNEIIDSFSPVDGKKLGLFQLQLRMTLKK